MTRPSTIKNPLNEERGYPLDDNTGAAYLHGSIDTLTEAEEAFRDGFRAGSLSALVVFLVTLAVVYLFVL